MPAERTSTFQTAERTIVSILPVAVFLFGQVLLLLSGNPDWSIDRQAVAFFSGLALMIAATLRLGTMSWRWFLALFGVTLVGLLLRLINLETSVHFLVDEDLFVVGVNHIRHNPNVDLFGSLPTINAFTNLYPYLQLQTAAIMGRTLTSLRLISVVLGTATMPAIYFLGCHLASRRMALLAAAFLAVFPLHLHMSRLGLNNIADPLFGVLSLAFLARGLREESSSDFVMAGIMLGLTQYWYEGGRLLFPLLVIGWLLVEMICRRIWSLAGLLIASALLVASPLLLHGSSGATYARLADAGVGADYLRYLFFDKSGLSALGEYWREGLQPVLAHLFYAPDSSVFFFGGDTAVVFPLVLPFVLVGAVRRRWLLLAWILIAVLGISLIIQPGNSARYIVMVPALVLLAALGADALITRWKWAWLFVGLVIAALPVYYFGHHIPLYNEQIRRHADFYDPLFRVQQFEQRLYLLYVTDERVYLPQAEALADYLGVDANLEVISPALLGSIAWPRQTDIAVFLRPDDQLTLYTLSRAFVPLPAMQDSPFNVPHDQQYSMIYLDLVR